MITPEFEIFCYLTVTIAILYSRHNPFKKAVVQPLAITPIVEPTPVPITVIEYKPAKKPRQYANAVAPNHVNPPLRVKVERIDEPLPPFTPFDKNGNKLRGAALRKRRIKYGLPPEE